MKNTNTNEFKGCDYTPIFLEDTEAREARTHYAEGLTYEINNGNETCTITGIYMPEGEKLNIPPVIEGFKVTGIGDDAFVNYHRLQSVIIPNSVTWIGNNAFWGCNRLTSVTMDNSVAWIGDGAFAYCSSLTEINFTGKWESVDKVDGWDRGVDSYVVHRTDGDIK